MFRKFVVFVLLLILIVAAWLAYGLVVPVRAKTDYVLLKPGWTTKHIAQELKNEGAIRSTYAFLFYHYVVRPKSLKAGEYEFKRPYTAVDVHGRLVRGDIFKHTVVIPEGFNMFDIAAAIEAAKLGSGDDFLKLAENSVSLVSDIDPQAKSLEGYLFPDTYQFTRTQTMTDIVATMVKRFKQEAKAIGLLATPDPTQVHRLVTMASIVEKETGSAEERPLVASVYYNRLAQKMGFQADPSVIYASMLAGHWSGVIHQSDLQLDSPYNTYKHAGLPPGPICNPGRASLEAAMHPADTNYLYFVSDNNGHHRFARSLEEHSRNVAAYRRAVANANR
jgi:peptidoglycan lytic transglycosylase G